MFRMTRDADAAIINVQCASIVIALCMQFDELIDKCQSIRQRYVICGWQNINCISRKIGRIASEDVVIAYNIVEVEIHSCITVTAPLKYVICRKKIYSLLI